MAQVVAKRTVTGATSQEQLRDAMLACITEAWGTWTPYGTADAGGDYPVYEFPMFESLYHYWSTWNTIALNKTMSGSTPSYKVTGFASRNSLSHGYWPVGTEYRCWAVADEGYRAVSGYGWNSNQNRDVDGCGLLLLQSAPDWWTSPKVLAFGGIFGFQNLSGANPWGVYNPSTFAVTTEGQTGSFWAQYGGSIYYKNSLLGDKAAVLRNPKIYNDMAVIGRTHPDIAPFSARSDLDLTDYFTLDAGADGYWAYLFSAGNTYVAIKVGEPVFADKPIHQAYIYDYLNPEGANLAVPSEPVRYQMGQLHPAPLDLTP